jgi:hypothetical protein
VNEQQARVLARDGNVAVTWLTDRAYPGLHVQGDTFAELYRQLADATGRIRRTGDEGEALDDLDDAISQMRTMLRFYESTLAQRDVRLPYPRDGG